MNPLYTSVYYMGKKEWPTDIKKVLSLREKRNTRYRVFLESELLL